MLLPSRCFGFMIRHRPLNRSTSKASAVFKMAYVSSQGEGRWPPPLSIRLQTALDSGNSKHLSATRRLFLVDAMDPIARVHFAYKERIQSPSGQDTTVLFGFMKTLFAMLSTHPTPSYCIVAFDASGSDFRQSIYPGYKGQRDETPQEIIDAIPMIQTALDRLGIKWISVQGIEADDVIGCLTRKFAEDTCRAYIFSRDKDFFQLLDENVVLIRGPMKEGVFKKYTKEVFIKEFDVDPGMWIEVMALQGDASDNIPGVHNIGIKRALQLVSTYGRIEDIFDHISEMSPGVIKEALTDSTAWSNALLSRDLVKIASDLNLPPLRFGLQEARVKLPSDSGKGFLEFITQKGIHNLHEDLVRFLVTLAENTSTVS